MQPLDALTQAFDTVQSMLDLAPVTDSDLRRPTPCRRYDVGALADHIRDTHVLLLNAAVNHPVGEVTDPLADSHHRLAKEAVEAWRLRGVSGEVSLGDVSLHAEFALALHTVETFVHGWDLAAALGREFAPAAMLTDHVWSLLPAVASDDARGEGPDAPYAPAIELRGDAPLLDRVIAFTGRDPHWQASTDRLRQAG